MSSSKTIRPTAQSLISYLSSYPSSKPITLPQAIQKLRFSVANTGASSKSHRFLGKTYLPKEFDENEVVELPLRHLAYNNVHVPIEFTFRKDERAATDSNATEPASLEPYWTREFVDVWTKGSSAPARIDITRKPQSEIIDLLTSFNPSDLPSIPLTEGPELESYVSSKNASDLVAFKASSAWKTPEQRLARRSEQKAAAEAKVAAAAAEAARKEEFGSSVALPLFGVEKQKAQLGEKAKESESSESNP